MTRRTLKGALVVSLPDGQQRTIVFQYNPANLTRRVSPQTVGGDPNSRSAALAYTGAPIETIQAQIDVEADDQVTPEPTIEPLLAAIETILYPSSRDVQRSLAMLNAGVLEIGVFQAPVTLFAWGERVAPVRITSYSVTEQAFSPELRAIRAQIDLEMQVLRYSDVPVGNPAFESFAAYHRAKEQLAQQVRS